jgi:hypothetical protein
MTSILRRSKSSASRVHPGIRPQHHVQSAQKKAQPEEAALKVPPKEEVLEECASARWAAARLHCSKNPNAVQALSAAVRHIVDFSKLN